MPAMTVTPSFSEDAEGGRTVDFEIHKPFSGYQSADQDYITDSKGVQHHVMQDAELPGQMEVAYNPDGYQELCHELYGPDLQKAINWASSNWDQTKVELYDHAISSDDHSTMHQHIESLLHDYYASGKKVTAPPVAKSVSQERAMSEQVQPTHQSPHDAALDAYGDDFDEWDVEDQEDMQIIEAAFDSLTPDQAQDTVDLLNTGSEEVIQQTLDLLRNYYYTNLQ